MHIPDNQLASHINNKLQNFLLTKLRYQAIKQKYVDQSSPNVINT